MAKWPDFVLGPFVFEKRGMAKEEREYDEKAEIQAADNED